MQWFDKRAQLIRIIEHNFEDNLVFSEKEIADIQDKDGYFLCKKLSNTSWKNLLTDKEKFSFIIDDYLLLYSVPFCYFMPACMIASLYDIHDDYYIRNCLTFYEHTVYNLCGQSDYLKERYALFTPVQKNVIAYFLRLIFEVTEDERIITALKEHWDID